MIKMAAIATTKSCNCRKSHLNCCSCGKKCTEFGLEEITIGLAKIFPTKLASWLEEGSKSSYINKRGEKFKDSYIHNVYVTSDSGMDFGNFFAKVACFRSSAKAGTSLGHLSFVPCQ